MAITDEELEAEVRDYNLKRRTEPSEPMIEITAHEAIALMSQVQKKGPLASAVFILDLLSEEFGDDLSSIWESAHIWDGDHQFPFDGGLFSIGCGTAATWFMARARRRGGVPAATLSGGGTCPLEFGPACPMRGRALAGGWLIRPSELTDPFRFPAARSVASGPAGRQGNADDTSRAATEILLAAALSLLLFGVTAWTRAFSDHSGS